MIWTRIVTGGLVACVLAGAGAALAAPGALGDMPPPSQADSSTLYLGIIDGLIDQHRHAAALAFLDSYALAEKNPAPRYWLLRGQALLALHRPVEAARAFVRLDGTALAGAGWNGRGQAAAALAQWTEATGDFEKAAASDPANADFLNNLAFAQLKAGHRQRAVASLRQARELAPQSELIRNNLLIALTVNGEDDAARRLLGAITDPDRRRQAQAMVRDAIAKSGLERDGS
jgi:tetratricopeptide (TPR) repeat protein